MEFGITTFVELTPDPVTGKTISAGQRMKNLLEEIVLADKVGLDVFGIGEHHRKDYIVSSPVIPLAAAAAVTKKIRLSSAVSVLSSDDPVRVFQQFAELDLLSGGRAEIMAGRGSFIESFPLFGYSLNHYSELFNEKLELLLKIRESEKVTWSGNFRAPLIDQGIYPRPKQDPIPVWIAVGGTPDSVIRAGKLGLPLTIAIIGGRPDNFVPFVELYRETVKASGHDIEKLPVAINSHGYITETSQKAADEYFPYYEYTMNIIGKERGWAPLNRSSFDNLISPEGAVFVGSPDDVVEKILYEYDLFHHQRFMIQFSVATLPHEKIMNAIELFGTKVVPRVKKELKNRKR